MSLTMSGEGGEGDLIVRVDTDKRTVVLDTDLPAIWGRIGEDVVGLGAVLEAQWIAIALSHLWTVCVT